jgi:hypothetical protein
MHGSALAIGCSMSTRRSCCQLAKSLAADYKIVSSGFINDQPSVIGARGYTVISRDCYGVVHADQSEFGRQEPIFASGRHSAGT